MLLCVRILLPLGADASADMPLYVSAYYCIRVCILPLCPHTMCVCMLPYVSAYEHTVCVRILLYIVVIVAGEAAAGGGVGRGTA